MGYQKVKDNAFFDYGYGEVGEEASTLFGTSCSFA
jgi:hypothetical protein